MIWILGALGFIFFILVISIFVKYVNTKYISAWIDMIERGLPSIYDKTRTAHTRKDSFVFLAKHTRFRVIKHKDNLITQVKTFGSPWKDFVSKDDYSASQLATEQAMNIAISKIEKARADVRLYIETSQYEDPNRYKKIVVATRDVVEKT